MKSQVLFSLKNNEKIFMNVICCSDLIGSLRVNSILVLIEIENDDLISDYKLWDIVKSLKIGTHTMMAIIIIKME